MLAMIIVLAILCSALLISYTTGYSPSCGRYTSRSCAVTQFGISRAQTVYSLLYVYNFDNRPDLVHTGMLIYPHTYFSAEWIVQFIHSPEQKCYSEGQLSSIVSRRLTTFQRIFPQHSLRLSLYSVQAADRRDSTSWRVPPPWHSTTICNVTETYISDQVLWRS